MFTRKTPDYNMTHGQSFYRLQPSLFSAFMLILKGIFGGPCDGHVNLTEECLSQNNVLLKKS